MLLNKHNLNIAALADKEKSRFTLNAIQVSPERTAETDGHQLVIVSTVKTDAADFPQVPGMEPPVDSFKPFLLPAAEALNIAKALPKKTPIPVLANAAVSAETDVNGHSVIGVTDLENARAFRTQKPEGNFPDIDRVIPNLEGATLTIGFNPALLAKVLKQIESFQQGKFGPPSCTLSFYGPTKAMRIDADGGDDQHLTAVVMPMRI